MRLLCRIMSFIIKDFIMGFVGSGGLSFKMVITGCCVPKWRTPPASSLRAPPAPPVPLRETDDQQEAELSLREHRGDLQDFQEARREFFVWRRIAARVHRGCERRSAIRGIESTG